MFGGNTPEPEDSFFRDAYSSFKQAAGSPQSSHGFGGDDSDPTTSNTTCGLSQSVEDTEKPEDSPNVSQNNSRSDGFLFDDMGSSSVPQEPFTTPLNSPLSTNDRSFSDVNYGTALQDPLSTFNFDFNSSDNDVGSFGDCGALHDPSTHSGLTSESAGQTAHEDDGEGEPQEPFDNPNVTDYTVEGRGDLEEDDNQSFGTPSWACSSPSTMESPLEAQKSNNQSGDTLCSNSTPIFSGDSPIAFANDPAYANPAENSPIAAHFEESPVINHAENYTEQPTYAQLQARIAQLEAEATEKTREADAAAERKVMEAEAKIAAFMRSKRERTAKASPNKPTVPKTPPSASRKRVSKVTHGRKVIASPGEHAPDHVPGLIEKGWSPGTSREERSRLFDSPPPPLHVSPMFRELMNSRQHQTPAQAASKKVHEQCSPDPQVYPDDVVFHGGSAFAPAVGSSPPNAPRTPPGLTNSPVQSEPSSPIATPSHVPTKGKSKARAPAKPRATAASKRAAAATKPSGKVSKSTTTKRSNNASGPSPSSMRSLHELYNAQFGTLTHEEKCQLVLPLLQGFDPETGRQSATVPGGLATDDVFAAIGADTFGEPHGLGQVVPYDQTETVTANMSDAELQTQLGNFIRDSNADPSWSSQSQATGPQESLDTAFPAAGGDATSLTMAQQAAAELGPAELGGAMRQQAALKRSETRRR